MYLHSPHHITLFDISGVFLPASGIKFTPPILSRDIHILRKRLLNYLSLHNAKHRRSVFIEGYPGQGKSIFAAQYVKDIGKKFAWYLLTEEDRDPFIFASGLASAMAACFGESVTPATDRIVSSRDSSTPSPSFLADALLSDIRKNIREDSLYVVMDDLHHLDSGEGALFFFSSLIEKIIPFIHFIFISRPSERLGEAIGRSRRHPIRLDKAMLSFTADETAALMSLIRPDAISPVMVDRIQRKADGWAMGTVLLGTTYNEGSFYYSDDEGTVLDPSVPSTVFDYFSCEVFPDYQEGFLTDLEKLSLLSEIDLDLAAIIVSDQTISILKDSQNHPTLFVRRFGADKKDLEFHHLFRDALRLKASGDLCQDTRKGVLFSASDWYLEREIYDRALFYRLEADDFGGAAKIMVQGAHSFFWERYAVYLRDIFEKLPEEMIVSHSWLCYFHGAILMEIESKRAMKYLNLAWRLFRKEENPHGEMLCLSKFVFFNASAGGRYWYGAHVLKRLKLIFENHWQTVSPEVQVLTLNAISIGHTFFLAEYNEAYRYSEKAVSILKVHRLQSLYYSTKMPFYSAHAFSANWADYVTEIEQVMDIFTRPDLSPYTKMVFLIGILNYIKLVGDFDNFDPAADFFEEVFTKNLPRGKIPLLGFIDNWRIESAITSGNFCKAREVLKQAFLAPYSNISIHTYGQLVHNKVFVAALTGESIENIDAYAAEAIRLRKKAGGPYFIWLCNLMIGSAYANIGCYDKALLHLDFVVNETDKAGNHLLGVAAYANRAWVGIRTGAGEKTANDLRKAISMMKERDLLYFYTWTPHMMREVFAEAMRLGIEPEFVRSAAGDKVGLGFTADCKPVPLLKIEVFGGLRFIFRDRLVLDADDMPNKSFDFIVSLISSRNLGLSMERMGDILGHWDKDDKGTNAQQVMANRLRKRLKSAVLEIDPRIYLRIDKQYHRLSNSFVDIYEFRRLSEKAAKVLDEGRPWHASTIFRRAFALWCGSPFAGISMSPVLETALIGIWRDIDRAAFGFSSSIKTISLVMSGDISKLKEILWALVHSPFIDETDTFRIATARNMHEIYKSQGMNKEASDMLKIIFPEMS